MPSALGVFKFYLSAIIRRSTFIKPGSYLFSFRQHLFRLTYALHRQNYVYTLQIKANLSYVKLKTWPWSQCTYCNISTSCSTQCKRVAGIPAEFEFFFITRNILKPETKIQKVNAQKLITYKLTTCCGSLKITSRSHISYLALPSVPASFFRLISPSSVAQLH